MACFREKLGETYLVYMCKVLHVGSLKRFCYLMLMIFVNWLGEYFSGIMVYLKNKGE